MLREFMLFITDIQSFIIPAILIFPGLIYVERRHGLVLIFSAVLILLINDFISHQILKEFFARTRPCHVIDILQGIPHCTNSFSFPSNHASNIFTLATLSSLCYRNTTLLAMTVALIIGFSRIYLGFHYPSDVLGGALCGIVMGLLGYKMHLYFQRFFIR
jgi:undecaprenyl-diphosphatase